MVGDLLAGRGLQRRGEQAFKIAVVLVDVLGEHGQQRLALAGPVGLIYGSVFALVQLGLVITYPGRPASALWAVLATACYLPLFLWHIRCAIAGIRPPAAVWTVRGGKVVSFVWYERESEARADAGLD